MACRRSFNVISLTGSGSGSGVGAAGASLGLSSLLWLSDLEREYDLLREPEYDPLRERESYDLLRDREYDLLRDPEYDLLREPEYDLLREREYDLLREPDIDPDLGDLDPLAEPSFCAGGGFISGWASPTLASPLGLGRGGGIAADA